MTLHTYGVGAAVTPTVVGTWLDHYLNRKKRKQKPTAHISYDVALNLIRKFLVYASHHTVEDIQAFTSQWVPTPTWIHTEGLEIPEATVAKAADLLAKQLGPDGIKLVGGQTWWQWRRPGAALKADWIEMKSDYKERQRRREKCSRVIFYVHGGGYFFGSVDEHRYQMQRHARKLKARVFAPRYRLSPQFPFPCGLHDCLAAYLHLLTLQDPTTIVLAGDSAGGGMVTSMLVVLRDLGLPLPAGAILISPWVDLTHSFPSVAGDNPFDYIPPYGFLQKPSISWPPPNADDLAELQQQMNGTPGAKAASKPEKQTTHEETAGVVIKDPAENGTAHASEPAQVAHEATITGPSTTALPSKYLSLMIDGKEVYLRDQIQMYASNEQLSHPLVSPVLQPSLGGLPPLLILAGGGEMLRDEQIYLAHKAANPAKFPPGNAYLDQTPGAREQISKYKPTHVQLQVWEDLCHVAPTLSFTRPAKYMYRSIAQFGAWALAQAQHTDIDIVDDDEVSVISADTSDEEDDRARKDKNEVHGDGAKATGATNPTNRVGRAGDDIPHFRNHMVRQRCDCKGNIYPLAPEADLPALQLHPSEIGVVKPGPVRKWIAAKAEWDRLYGKQKRKVQKQRLNEMRKGFQRFEVDGVVEQPPPSAIASRRGLPGTEAPKQRMSQGLAFWSMIGSNHDKDAVDREEKLDKEADGAAVTVTNTDGVTDAAKRPASGKSRPKSRPGISGRPGSKHRSISYHRNFDNMDGIDENTPAAELIAAREGTSTAGAVPDSGETKLSDPNLLSPSFVPLATLKEANASSENGSAVPVPALLAVDEAKDPLVLPGTHVTLSSSEDMRPKADGVAFPFRLGKGGLIGDHARNASTITLMSSVDGASTGGRPETPASLISKPGEFNSNGPATTAQPGSPLAASAVLTAASVGAATEAVYAHEINAPVPSSPDHTRSGPAASTDLPDLEATPKAKKSALSLAPSDSILPTVLQGPVRTETPTLEKQLNGVVAGSGIASHSLGARGDETPTAGTSTAGWATPRAGSLSTAAPSEAGDRPPLERFETAEE